MYIPAIPEQQRRRKDVPSTPVSSDAHKGRPCTACILCKETSLKYTHPVKWKDRQLLDFLQSIEKNVQIEPDSCICRNCRENLSCGRKQNDYRPRWINKGVCKPNCEVIGCGQTASRCTKLANKEEIGRYLKCSLQQSQMQETHLCDKHYRMLHRQLSPASYQWKCSICSVGIRGCWMSLHSL